MKKKLLFLLILPLFFLPKILGLFIPFLVKLQFGGDLRIQKTTLSWLGPQRFEEVSFSKKGINAYGAEVLYPEPFWRIGSLKESFTLSQVTLRSQNGEIVNLNATVKGNDLRITGQTPEGGTLEIDGVGTFPESFDIKGVLHQIPTSFLTNFFKISSFNQFLGQTIDLRGSFNSRGKLNITGASSSLSFSCDGDIAGDRFTLNKDLVIHSFLDKLKIKDLELQGKTEVSCIISSEGFLLPIKDPKKLRIKRGMLNLGKLRLLGINSLPSLVNLFRIQSNVIECWFSPADFSFHQGTFVFGRIDGRFDRSIHLCLWGKINIDQNTLDMTLGIPNDTLWKSFGVKTFGNNYVLQIPVSGTIESPELNLGPAIAKIGAMKASESIGSTKGKVLGGLFNLFTQEIDGETAPEPSYPFPWEN